MHSKVTTAVEQSQVRWKKTISDFLLHDSFFELWNVGRLSRHMPELLTDTRAVNVDGIHILVGFALLQGIPKNKVVA